MAKCNIITLGKINKKIFLILIGGVIYTAILFIEHESMFFGDREIPDNQRNQGNEENQGNQGNAGDEKKFQHPIIYSLMHSLSLCLSFIFLIIYYKNNNNKNKLALIENIDKININKQKSKKAISWKEKLLWILLVTIIDYASLIFSNICWIANDSYVGVAQINIIFMAIFSYFILKMKIYKHHYLCIFAIIIKCIISTIIYGVFNDVNKDEIVPLIVLFTTEIAFSLTYVLFKYFMLIKYINPYEIMFFQGLFESIFSIIFLTITTKFGFIDNFFHFIDNIDNKEIGIIVAWIVAYFIYMLIFYKTIEIFNQFYLYFSILISEYIVFFIEISNYEVWQIIVSVFLMVICSFMILVFVEIIELNFCGISDMIKKNIELRARADSMSSKNNDINIINDDEDNETFIDLKDYTYQME